MYCSYNVLLLLCIVSFLPLIPSFYINLTQLRWDTTNAYHNLEDVLGVFTTLAMINSTEVKEKGIQVGSLGGGFV